MFHQVPTPVGDSLGAPVSRRGPANSGGACPSRGMRRPAWQASLAALVALVVAVGPWQMPVGPAINSVRPAQTLRSGR